MTRKIRRIPTTALVAAALLLSSTTAAWADAPTGGQTACGTVVTPADPAATAEPARHTTTPTTSKPDIYAADRATWQPPSTEHSGWKSSAVPLTRPVNSEPCTTASRRTAVPADSGSGWATITNMVHYTQTTGYYCGPAVVSEMSATVPGPSPVQLNQNTVASYMQTDVNGATNYQHMVDGLNHFVGVPDFGRNFYEMVWMNDPPTQAQRATFLSHLQTDVSQNTPIAGLAYEVAGGPHLPGHPNANIGHWFEIGGWNTNTQQVWFADSSQNPWPNVPAYSWYSINTVEDILGGAGYIW